MTAHPHAPAAAPPGDGRYRISEAASRVGVSPSALRLWERQGLVTPMRTRGRYRLYSDDDVDRLRRVRRMREVEKVNAPGIRQILSDGGAVGERSVDGVRLRVLRQARALSLRAAADLTGLSISFISSLERGASGASVSALQRLTHAYGTTLLELFAGGESAGRLVRPSERPVLEVGGSGVRIEQLAAGATQLEPQLFVLASGATSDGSYAHDGEEFLYVLEGALTVWIAEGECYQLSVGDALSFPSTLPHRWRNDASGETRLLWINTPPTF